MTQAEVLQIGSRLYKHLGSPGGRAAIYPKFENGTWHLLVKAERSLELDAEPDAFEGVDVRYERYG